MSNETKQHTYKIVRFYQLDKPRKIMAKGWTLEQAKEYCNSIYSCSDTNLSLLEQYNTFNTGAWFDGFEKE